jgi:hypothetical protein
MLVDRGGKHVKLAIGRRSFDDPQGRLIYALQEARADRQDFKQDTP